MPKHVALAGLNIIDMECNDKNVHFKTRLKFQISDKA
jgi:hypothetical protein